MDFSTEKVTSEDVARVEAQNKAEHANRVQQPKAAPKTESKSAPKTGLTDKQLKSIEWVNSLLAFQQNDQNFIQDRRFQEVLKLEREGKLETRDGSGSF